jgi:hypothetical protein
VRWLSWRVSTWVEQIIEAPDQRLTHDTPAYGLAGQPQPTLRRRPLCNNPTELRFCHADGAVSGATIKVFWIIGG